jgi:transcriptional regulator
MNVIQQEALAKSVGMTREDLASSLIERQALSKIGEGDKTAAEAYNRLKKQGLSDDEIAARLGDDKLATQIGNSLTFFTKQHVVK